MQDSNPRRHLFVVTHTTLNADPYPERLTQRHLFPLAKPRRFGRGHGQPGAGIPFRLYDDDGNLYYQGISYDDGTEEQAFAPLDWGLSDSGCTELRHRSASGAWQTL